MNEIISEVSSSKYSKVGRIAQDDSFFHESQNEALRHFGLLISGSYALETTFSISLRLSFGVS